MSTFEISVIIPVRNEAKKIERCLNAVFSQSCRPREVIVVDGHSTDETVESARKLPVTVLYEDYGTRSGACQVGIEYASGKYIAFTDADCIPEPDWLAKLAVAFDDGIAGVGGAIKNIGEDFWVHSVNLAYGTFLGSANSVQGRLFKNSRFVNSISGCNSMYRRQDIFDAGGFNPRLPGAEDVDLNSRILKKGRLLYYPEAVILHDHGRGFKQFARQMFRYGSDRGIARKFGLQAVPPLMLPLIFLSLIFSRWLLPGLIVLYLAAVLTIGARFAVKERNIKYLLSLPAIYITEHSLYSAGFWKGLIKRR